MVGMSFSSILDMQSLFFAADKIFEILDRNPLIDSTPATGLKLNDTLEGNIALKSGEFTYPTRPDIKVLNKISLAVKAGQRVVLVGESGCGKLLHTVHRPMHPKVEGRESASKSASNGPKEKVKQKLPWTPINPKFFNDDDDDESDDDNSKTESNTEEIPRGQASDSDTSQSSDNLEWDDSPEQDQLDGSRNEEFEETIRPRRLFSDAESSAANDDLTYI